MVLCNLCEIFDIRQLLCLSAAQKPNATGNTDRNFVDTNDYRVPIPNFYKHHEGIVTLKGSADQGCELCRLFWHAWVKTLNKDHITEEFLEKYFPGQLYIGCSSWTTSRQGFPYVTLTQQFSIGSSRTLCSFEAFADRDDVPVEGRALLGRAVYSFSASKECISVVEEWLRTCANEHKECSPLSDHASPLPTRVIDVGDEKSYPRLVTNNDKIEPWIALSYCWGGDSQFVCNDRTMHDLQCGIPLNDSPATLRDAVIITRSLGIKYIWIDALCIKQDSAEDWAREAAKMRDVYSGAILTIVAANSPSTHSGIFSQRISGERATLEWRDSPDSRTNKVQLRLGSELWDHALSSSPLMSRGWTLQEGLLSPRTVSYGAQQMIWGCPCYRADEGGRITQATEDYRSKGFIQNLIRIQNTEVMKPQSFLEKLILQSRKPEKWWKSYAIADPYDKWNDIAEQFMCRSLTKDFDALPALSGLARVFQHILKDDYCARLWKKGILSTLMWNRSPRYPADSSTRFDLARPSDYLAPSWSWISILGKQSSMSNSWQTREALRVSVQSTTKIISLQTFPKGADPFGQVTGGELVLHTRFGKIEHLPPVYSTEHEFCNETPKSVTGSAFQELVYTNMRVVDSMVYEFFRKHSPCSNQEFGAVELIRWEKAPGSLVPGLDLLLVESTGHGGAYRRIAQLGLRKSPVPDEDDVGADMYRGTLLENNAYDEVIKAKWKKRTIILV